MDNRPDDRRGQAMWLPRYASRGTLRFLMHYVFRRPSSHLIVLIAVLAAVGCAIGSQYAVKNLVDVLSSHTSAGVAVWGAGGGLLALAAGDIAAGIIRKASGSQYLHQRYAGRTAAVTGNLADVVSNIGLVRSFGAAPRERVRLSREIDNEMTAQRESLRALERLRLSHAIAGFAVAAGMLAWAVNLWP